MKENVGVIAEKRNLEKEIIYLSGSDPVLLDEKIIKDLYNITDSLNLSSIKMPSGAGHDAMEFGDKVDAGMLFIPNKDGISHNPEEFARIKDIENAKNVLYEYILKE
ncbi:MAG TPA: M20/M25/M40 family metallo-hydrolase [Tissierellaceae bacterium]